MVYLLTVGAEEDRITQLLIFAAAGVAVIWPAAGLAMLAIVMPMKEGEILGPVRFNAVLAGAISFGCLLRLPFDRMRIRVHPGVVLMLGYVIYSAASIPAVLTGYPPEWTPSALNLLLRLGTGVALFLSASYLFRLTSPRVFLWLALAGAGLAALLALADITGFLPLPSLTHGLLDSTSGLRASGAFADPNFFGQYIATAAVLGLGLLAVSSTRARVVLVPLVVLFFLCVVLSFSRTALIGAVAGVTVLLAMRHRRAALIFLLTAMVLGVTLYPAFLELRQGAQLTPADQYDMVFTQDSRSTIAAAGLAMFAASPIFGVGFGVFQYVSPGFFEGGAPDSTYSHNQYVNILAEQGIVGVVLGRRAGRDAGARAVALAQPAARHRPGHGRDVSRGIAVPAHGDRVPEFQPDVAGDGDRARADLQATRPTRPSHGGLTDAVPGHRRSRIHRSPPGGRPAQAR